MKWKPCKVALGEGPEKEGAPGNLMECECRRGGAFAVFKADGFRGYFAQCVSCGACTILADCDLTREEIVTLVKGGKL